MTTKIKLIPQSAYYYIDMHFNNHADNWHLTFQSDISYFPESANYAYFVISPILVQ